MVQTIFRLVLCSFLSLAYVLPAWAIPFQLPENAVLDIQNTTPAGSRTPKEVPEEIYEKLVLLLHKNNITVCEPAARHPELPAPLAITPLRPTADTANDAARDFQRNTPEDDGNDSDLEEEEKSILEEPLEETAPLLPDEEAGIPTGPTHILEVSITLFQESVGTPSRVGNSIRIRTEVSLHCTYKIKDAATGSLLVTDTASGSAARAISSSGDIDATLETLRARAVTNIASTLVDNLSGRHRYSNGYIPDDEYYQDSPGKMLKPH